MLKYQLKCGKNILQKKLQFIALKNWGCASNPATYIHNFPISDAVSVIKVLKK